MRELILGHEITYTPEQFGLETPLLFARNTVSLSISGSDYYPIRHIQTDLAQQTIELQVSDDYYDRATIPVWMVHGELEDGFFRGVLRPSRHHKNAVSIAFSRSRLEFRYYMENLGLPELGVEIIQEHMRPQSELKTRTMISGRRLLPGEITPYFDVNLDPSDHSLVIFKS